LEKLREARQHIRPTVLAAERVALVSPAVRIETDKAVKQLEAAISAAKKARCLFVAASRHAQ